LKGRTSASDGESPLRRIGLISDTHGILDAKVGSILDGVSHIVHAGDVGTSRVLERLRRIAAVTAVRGNVDTGDLACLPEFALVELCGIRIFATHIIGRSAGMKSDVLQAIRASKPDVVVYGHTHVHVAEKTGGIIFVNPGGSGPKRFHYPRTVADIAVTEGLLMVNFYDLDGKEAGRIIDAQPFEFRTD
jgi:putative phosphoesterase